MVAVAVLVGVSNLTNVLRKRDNEFVDASTGPRFVPSTLVASGCTVGEVFMGALVGVGNTFTTLRKMPVFLDQWRLSPELVGFPRLGAGAFEQGLGSGRRVS
jgi:hypothetical protein